MQDKKIALLISSFIDNELSPKQRLKAIQHIHSNPKWAAHYHELLRIKEMLQKESTRLKVKDFEPPKIGIK